MSTVVATETLQFKKKKEWNEGDYSLNSMQSLKYTYETPCLRSVPKSNCCVYLEWWMIARARHIRERSEVHQVRVALTISDVYLHKLI